MTTLRASGKLNHYLIENLVARSGMASIFRATDKRTGVPKSGLGSSPQTNHEYRAQFRA
jgi:hypothetical protein